MWDRDGSVRGGSDGVSHVPQPVIAILIISFLPLSKTVTGKAYPLAQILTHRTVVRDGWHNMCTDICFWRDTFWLVYDRTSAHSAPDGVVVVLRSSDLRRWDEVAVLATPNDARDVKLAATEDELLVFCTDSWYEPVAGRKRQVAQPYLFSSPDGRRWSDPTRIHERNYWLWRVRRHEGVFYCAEKGGDLLSSEDGRHWTFVSRIPDDEGQDPNELKEIRKIDHRTTPRFNEADVIFRPDGQLWCVSRTKREPGQHSLLYISDPPYERWSCVDLQALIHCPALCDSGGNVYVAGRRDPTVPWIPQHSPVGNTGIFRLDPDGVTPVFALPSDGDAAYPGLVSVEPDQLIVSYYSQHAYLSGVLRADRTPSTHIERWGVLRREEAGQITPRKELSNYKSGPVDIYVAEIDLAAEGKSLAF